MKNFIFILSTFLCFQAYAQTPATEQSKRIMLYGATAHIGNGNVIENSLIILEEGKILTIEDASKIRIDISNAEYYDVIGKHVYPGFILPNTTLGLADIDAVRATRDFDEVGEFNPHIRSIIAYNTDSPVIPTIRTNGILIGQITPQGGTISGTSSIVELMHGTTKMRFIRKMMLYILTGLLVPGFTESTSIKNNLLIDVMRK